MGRFLGSWRLGLGALVLVALGVLIALWADQAVQARQDAARALDGEVEAFFVIGGDHSSNSRKLLAVCKEQCEESFLIQTEEDIDPDQLAGVEKVGVTAGASTPKWLIDKVVERLESL